MQKLFPLLLILGWKLLFQMSIINKQTADVIIETIELSNKLKLTTKFDDALEAVNKAIITGAPDSEIYRLLENIAANKSWSTEQAKMLQKTIAEKGGWIGKYFDSDLKPKWPENDGFVKGTEKIITLSPGTIIDRYGTPGGRFASPVGTPYDSRSLVPGTKETLPYCIYEVVEPLEVKAAVVAEWFGKPGGGIQYALEKDMDFQKLLDRGIIRQVN